MARSILIVVVALVMAGSAAGFSTTPDPHVPDLPTTTGTVGTLLCDGNYLYVGGWFTQIGGIARRNLAAVNVRTGEVDPDWDPSPDLMVHELVACRGKIYATGLFTNIGGEARSYVAALEPAGSGRTGRADARWNPILSGQILFPPQIATDGNYIYLAYGFFQMRAFPPADGHSDGTADTLWGSANATNSVIRDILAAHGKLYAAGDFSQIRGSSDSPYLAALELAGDGRTGQLDPSWRPLKDAPASGRVTALAADERHVYAGGAYQLPGVGGGLLAFEPADGVTTGSADAAWKPDPKHDSSPEMFSIDDLLVHRGHVLLAGYFTKLGSVQRLQFAIVPAAGGGVTGAPIAWINGIPMVYTIAASGEGFFIGGNFWTINGRDGNVKLAGFDTVPRSAAAGWEIYP